jgi:hypothetical protein
LNSALESEVNQFASFVKSIASANPNAIITLTGYSLGGGIAQIVGSYANVQTVTFDAPGSAAFRPAFSSLASLASLQMLTPSTGNWDYRFEGDQVSQVGQQIGQSITVINPLMTNPNGTSTGSPYAVLPQVFVDQFHSEQLLDDQLALAPSTPGDTSDSQIVVLGNPDQNPLNQLVNGILVGGYTTLFQTQVEQTAMSFDPPPGYAYTLDLQAGSPDIMGLQLPVGIYSNGLCVTGWIGACVAGWTLEYQTSDGQFGVMSSPIGSFDFSPGISELFFFPTDPSGSPVFYADPFIFTLSFYETGAFDAMLTTDPNPLSGPSSVPEPATLAILFTGLLILAGSKRNCAKM